MARMKLDAIFAVVLTLLVAGSAFAQPSIVDFNDVLNEGYPNTGGFEAQNATSLTISTPNATVTKNDQLIVLATHIGDNRSGITTSIATVGTHVTKFWNGIRGMSKVRVSGLGSVYAWYANVENTQTDGATVTITTSAPTDIDAIIFEVTDTASPPIDGLTGKANQSNAATFTTPVLTTKKTDDLIIAFSESQYPAADPPILTPGFDDLNWLGIGNAPAAFGAVGAAGSYSVEFAQSKTGHALAAIFAITGIQVP
jgi:hypothetical protein